MGFTAESLKEAMKYMLESQGFDRVLRKMKLQSATPGKVVCELKVEEEHTNRGGTLHGGLTATLVDVVSTAALLYTERAMPGVSVDMNITYTSAAKIGEEILITAQILKQGRSLAFATVDLTNKATGKLIAQAPSAWSAVRSLKPLQFLCYYLDEQRIHQSSWMHLLTLAIAVLVIFLLACSGISSYLFSHS